VENVEEVSAEAGRSADGAGDTSARSRKEGTSPADWLPGYRKTVAGIPKAGYLSGGSCSR
jgi:hypothetical protein